MDIQSTIPIVQIAVSAIVIILVLVQNKGTGLSGVFGGDSAVFTQRRGAERNIFIATIVFAILFLATAMISILIK